MYLNTTWIKILSAIFITVFIVFAIALLGIGHLNLGGDTSSETTRDAEIREPKIIPDVPKDAIPPLFNPKYISSAEAIWLDPNDLILGFEHNGDARAYPLLILNWHEIVNDDIGGREVVVTYCPLCRSGIVFDREVDGKVLSFGNTGSLYESAMVMYDRETESYWWQVGGASNRGFPYR